MKIASFAFAPPQISAAAGQRVTWVNDDVAPHGVAVKEGATSDLLAPRERYAMKFNRPGSYDYNCSVHPYMKGRVIVQ